MRPFQAGAAVAILIGLGACVGTRHDPAAFAPAGGPPPAPASALEAGSADERAGEGNTNLLFVSRRGWHVDVGFALAALRPPLASLGANFPTARFVSIGFGDRRYLETAHKDWPNMLAALWPGDGMMLVTGLSAAPEKAFGAANVVRLALSPEQMRAAERFVAASIGVSGDAVEVEAQGPYPGSLYLTSTLRYSAARTCNTWVAEVLRSAGLPAHTLGVVFAGQVWRQARSLATSSNAPERDGSAIRPVPRNGQGSIAGGLSPVLADHRGP